MNINLSNRYLAILLISLCFTAATQAADEAVLMDSWVIDIKPGQNAAFEQALKTNLVKRTQQDEPSDWWVYTPVTGEHLNRYIVRSCCHTWTSFDQQRQWSAQHLPEQQWIDLLQQHASNYSRKISKADFPNSQWPEGLLVPGLMGITKYHIKSGHDSAFQAAKSRMSKLAIAGEWQRNWLWVETVTGENIETLMVLHPNFADMAPLETDIFDVLSKQLGSDDQAAQLFDELFSHISHEQYQIYQARPDLFTAPE